MILFWTWWYRFSIWCYKVTTRHIAAFGNIHATLMHLQQFTRIRIYSQIYEDTLEDRIRSRNGKTRYLSGYVSRNVLRFSTPVSLIWISITQGSSRVWRHIRNISWRSLHMHTCGYWPCKQIAERVAERVVVLWNIRRSALISYRVHL